MSCVARPNKRNSVSHSQHAWHNAPTRDEARPESEARTGRPVGTPPAAKPEPQGLVTVVSAVALEPIAGAPKEVSERMARMLDAASQRAQIALLNYEGAEGDYRLRGDLKASRQQNSIKVTYSWQVFDRTGTVVGRRSGSESAAGAAAGSDLWGAVPEAALQAIAEQGIAAVVNRR